MLLKGVHDFCKIGRLDAGLSDIGAWNAAQTQGRAEDDARQPVADFPNASIGMHPSKEEWTDARPRPPKLPE